MNSDSFHRLAKSLVDSGEAASIDEAIDVFSRYGVRFRLPASLAADPTSQVLALTAINAAARSFQGNVVVDADNSELTVRGFEGTSLYSFLHWVGVKSSVGSDASRWPTIVVGTERKADGQIAVWSRGWSFGLGEQIGCGELFVPACVAAGGLAVSEAFSVLRKDNPYAGRRTVTISLWNPRATVASGEGILVPQQLGLWLVGLGHLGQAYAWALGFIESGDAPLFLQDTDSVTESSISTSMLSTRWDIGVRKTRVVSAWLERRGYKTALVERRFDEYQRVGVDEPSVALFGVDNPSARRVLEGSGFRLVIDAGLGSGYRDFRAIRMRCFPGPSDAATLWAAPNGTAAAEPLAPAYRRLLQDGASQCGVTTLATRAEGAPFVGCVAAGFVLAERMRRQLSAEALGFVDLNLRSPGMLEAG